MIDRTIPSERCILRWVLITNGLRPVSQRFTTLQGQPMRIVSWDGASSGRFVESIARFKVLARCYARLRKRQNASMSHLCRDNNLLYGKYSEEAARCATRNSGALESRSCHNFRVPLDASSGAKHYSLGRYQSTPLISYLRTEEQIL